MFCWATETIEGLAWHIAKVPRQRTMAAITYYRRKGETEVVERILFARRLSKKYRILLQAMSIEQELMRKEDDEKKSTIQENQI